MTEPAEKPRGEDGRYENNRGKKISTKKHVGKQSVAALCQRYSVPATRILVDRILDVNPKTKMSDSDLIKAVTVINDRAYGKPTSSVDHNVQVDVSVQHLDALKDMAETRMKVIGSDSTLKKVS